MTEEEPKALETMDPTVYPKEQKSMKGPIIAIISIMVVIMIILAIALPLALIWIKLETFEGDPKFYMCSLAKCVSVKFDAQAQQVTDFSMQIWQGEEVKLDEGFTFFGVGSDKNAKGYVSQSMGHQVAGDNGQIFHQAITSGFDQKITLCDMVGQTLPIQIPIKKPAECNLAIDPKKGTVQNTGTSQYLAVVDDTLTFQAEKFSLWAFYEANQFWDLKEYVQDQWTKNNKAEYQAAGKVYVDQEGGKVMCGDHDDRYKWINYCGILQGHCTSNDVCKTGLVCAKGFDKKLKVFIPKFHEGENSYCQVEFCKKYGWGDDEIKCVECQKGYEGDLCTKKA